MGRCMFCLVKSHLPVAHSLQLWSTVCRFVKRRWCCIATFGGWPILLVNEMTVEILKRVIGRSVVRLAFFILQLSVVVSCLLTRFLSPILVQLEQQASQYLHMQQQYATMQQAYYQQMAQGQAHPMYPPMMPGQRFSPSLYAHMTDPGGSADPPEVLQRPPAAVEDKKPSNSDEVINLD